MAFDMNNARQVQAEARHVRRKIFGYDLDHGLPGDGLSDAQWVNVLDDWRHVLENCLDEMDTETTALLIAGLVYRLRAHEEAPTYPWHTRLWLRLRVGLMRLKW